MKRIVVLFALAICLAAPLCTAAHAQTAPPEGYRVTKYESRTHEWTIIRTGTFDGEFQKKKLVVVCHKFVNFAISNIPTYGPDVCHLQVGQFMARKLAPMDSNAPILDIEELGSAMLIITEGTINRQMEQVFDIKSIELLNQPR